MGEAEKKPILREDLYEYHFLSDVCLSPAGTSAAYVVNRALEEENCYQAGVWVLDLESGKNQLMALRGGAKNPLWLDEKNILFASERDQKKECGKKETRYYSIHLAGGEPEPYMTVPVKAEKLVYLNKDRFLVVAEVDEREVKPQEEYAAEEGKDYYIFEELPFWINGKGIRSKKRTALFVYEKKTGKLERITPPYMDTVSYAVSHDGSLIAYAGPVYEELLARTSALYIYETDTGSNRQLTQSSLYWVDDICFMGRERIFYTGATYERMGTNPGYYFYDLDKDLTVPLPFCDAPVGNTVGSDAKYGSGKSLVYCEEKRLLYIIQTSWGKSGLFSMDEKGKLTEVTSRPGAILGFDIKGGKAIMTAMRGQKPAELFSISLEDGKEECLTGFHDDYFKTHEPVSPEAFRYDSQNGYVMEGYVIKPAGYKSGVKYPAVLEIHGGPKAVSGEIFFHEMQCLAADGFFVFYTNPRGSDGRGEAFADIGEAFGKDDFEDLMEFTDQVFARYEDIDQERTGICGGSYGGFMCNWMVGHTDRYKAAVSQRSISNFLTKMLYTDIGFYANRLQMGAYPWEDFAGIWSMSPLSKASDVKTPLLLLQSDEDYRCFMGEAVQMYSAVKRQGTDTRLVLFHGENHELSRGGKPLNRITRLKELGTWLNKYLK